MFQRDEPPKTNLDLGKVYKNPNDISMLKTNRADAEAKKRQYRKQMELIEQMDMVEEMKEAEEISRQVALKEKILMRQKHKTQEKNLKK